MNDLLQIADTIERNGGWHVAAVKIRAEVERMREVEQRFYASNKEIARLEAEISDHYREQSRILELERALRWIADNANESCVVAKALAALEQTK